MTTNRNPNSLSSFATKEKNTKRWRWAGSLIVVFYDGRKTTKNNNELGYHLLVIFWNWRKKLKDNDKLGVVICCKWGTKAKRRWQVRMLVVVSNNPRETNIKVFLLGCRRGRLVILFLFSMFFLFFSWVIEDDNELRGSSLFSAMQEKKVEDKDKVCSSLSSTLVS
jgi:hypothetical protein